VRLDPISSLERVRVSGNPLMREVEALMRSCLAVGAVVAVIAVAASGCGSSGNKKAQGASTSQPATSQSAGSPIDLRTFRGRYAATLTHAGLVAAGVDVVNVGGAGLWYLSIGRRSVTFIPAPAGGTTTYPIVAVTRSQITLGPNPDCSTVVGRTHTSIFKLSQTASGLQFTAVSVACKEDGGSLAVAPWRKR
jgi:hypothetical protein